MFSKYRNTPAGAAGLVLCLSLAVLVVYILFEKDFILGVSSFWQSSTTDTTQYFVGFNRYADAPWHLPLLHFNSINYPEGTSATFMDTVPLYALLLKLLVPKSFFPFNPYGFWIVLCFILQAVGAWWITRELRVNNWVFLFVITVLLLFSPTLMNRVWHTSLMSHWIILFALALYIRNVRIEKLTIAAWTLLLVTVFYINIYLFTMASGIYLASLLTVGFRYNLRILFYFTTPYLIIFSSLFVTLLPLPSTAVTQEFGFGFYSMNLLAPLTGGHVFRLQAGVYGGQSEGFNYLGFGVILLFALALWCWRQSGVQIFKRHWALSLLLFGYTFYALSNHIYFSEQLIAIFKYPDFLDGITSQFRASGRFFWTVGYCIVIFSLFVLYRYLNYKVFLAVALSLTALQIVDLKKSIETLHSIRDIELISAIDEIKWDEKINDHVATLYFYPKFKCGKEILPYTLLPAMKYAALRNYDINTGYIARYTPRCDDITEEIATSDMPNSAYLFVASEFDSLEEIMSFFPHDAAVQCEQVDLNYICSEPN